MRGVDLDSLDMRQIAAASRGFEADPASLSAQAAGGDGWTRTEHFLALVLDELRTANWQRTKDGAKGRNRPKPISPLRKAPGKRIGRTDRSPAQIAAWLDRLHNRTGEGALHG